MRPLLIAFILAGSPLLAQDEDPLVSNRPGFSNVWEIVEPGRVEVNAGLQYDRVEEDEAFSFGQILVRAGMTEKLELRVALNSYVDVSSPGGDLSGLEDPTLGLKSSAPGLPIVGE